MRKLIFALIATLSLASPAVLRAQMASSVEWQNKAVPIETFGQFPTLFDPRISPDGDMVAAKVRSGGVKVLALIALGDPNAKPKLIARDDDFSTDKIGQREVLDWSWINDKTLLIWLRSRDNIYGQWYDNWRVVAYNRDTGKTTPLGWDNAAGSAGDVLWKSDPDAPTPHLLLARQNNTRSYETMNLPEVVDVDVETGKFTTVMRVNPIVMDWRADADGIVRMGSSRDSGTGQLRVLYRPNAKAQFNTILKEKEDMYSESVLPSIFLRGSDKAYAYSNHEGYRALYEYDLASMKLGKKIFGVPGYDISGAWTTPDGKALEGVRYTDKRSRVFYFDPRLKEISSLLDETFGKGNVDILSTDQKREKIIFSVAEMGQAPTIYLFDTLTGNTGRLAYSNNTLKDAKLNPVSVIRYPASDGVSIEAILTMPRHRKGRNLPLLIVPHGGPWSRDDADWDAYLWAQAFAEQGYVVIQPNYRGSTGYGKEFGRAVDGNWGNRMQDDLNDAIPFLAKQGLIDSKRVCMLGWSYGGYAASRAAQRDGDKYRCTISGAGVHDLVAMKAYDTGYLGAYSAKTGMGAASDNLRAASPSLNAKDYSAPILIVHGARDQRVPVSQSRSLVSRLKGAGKVEGRDFVYVEQPLNTHNLLREEDRVQFLREALKFLQRHNPAYVPTDTDKPVAG